MSKLLELDKFVLGFLLGAIIMGSLVTAFLAGGEIASSPPVRAVFDYF